MMFLAFAAAAVSPATSAGPLNLICRPAAMIMTNTPSGVSTGVLTGSETVGIRINPDGTGEARVPRRMLPAVKTGNDNGWFPLVHLNSTADEITAQVRLNQYNKPKLTLDRVAGSIRIDGDDGGFSGDCQPFDEATPRKF